MRVRNYVYLVFVALAALALLAYGIRHAQELTRKNSRKNRREVFMMCSLLLLGILAILWNQLMGTGEATLVFRKSANDTFDQYVPYYLDLIRNIRAGNLPIWNHHFGMGSSMLATQEWLCDPFNLIMVPLCLIFGEGFLSQALAITLACRAFTAGILFWFLMGRFCDTPLARILGGVLFGLGGYLFTEGQHYFFGTTWVMVPLVLLSLERLMHDMSVRGFIQTSLICVVLIFTSIYSAFMTLLFSPFYVALRLLDICDGKPLSDYARRLGVCALAVLCGCILSGIVLLPTALYLFGETGRVSGADTGESRNALGMLATIMSPHSLIRLFSRLLGNGLISNGTNYGYLGGLNELEFVQGGLSCGVFVLLGQFAHWACTEAANRQRLAVFLGAAFIAFYYLDYFLPSLLTVFRYPTYRGCLGINAVLIIAMAVAFEKRVIERPPAAIPLALCLLFTVFVLGWSTLRTVNGKIDCIFYALAVVAMSALTALLVSGKAPYPTIACVLCAVLASTVIVDSFCEMHLNPNNVAPEDFPLSGRTEWGAETTEALDYLARYDDSFYRVERTYESYTKWNDSLNFGYSGISGYNSTDDGDVTEFFFNLWPEAITHSTINFSCYSYRKDIDNFQMIALTGIRYVISREPLDYGWTHLIERTDHGAYVYEVRPGNQTVSPLYVRTSVVTQSEAASLSLAERRAALDSALIVPDEDAADLFTQSGAAVTSESSLTEYPGGTLSGTLQTDADGVACLVIPHTKGWHVYVDGREVSTFSANYGFIGFEVEKGEHAIEARYVPDGLIPGAIVSIAGLALLCCSIRLVRRCAHDGHQPGHLAASS